MKKILLPLLVTCSFSAAAAPYVGVEYGMGTTTHDFQPAFNADNVQLDPKQEDGIASGFVGYAFNDAWALELGYSQFELSDSHSKYLGMTTVNGQVYTHELDWDSSVDAKQISLLPVYTYELNEKWSAKLKAGLTYTQYKASAGKYEEFELVANDDIEHGKTLSHTSSTTDSVGALVSAGVEYRILSRLAIGANAKYQTDSFASTASFNIGTTYYF